MAKMSQQVSNSGIGGDCRLSQWSSHVHLAQQVPPPFSGPRRFTRALLELDWIGTKDLKAAANGGAEG